LTQKKKEDEKTKDKKNKVLVFPEFSHPVGNSHVRKQKRNEKGGGEVSLSEKNLELNSYVVGSSLIVFSIEEFLPSTTFLPFRARIPICPGTQIEIFSDFIGVSQDDNKKKSSVLIG
jgi:hypothetical protein